MLRGVRLVVLVALVVEPVVAAPHSVGALVDSAREPQQSQSQSLRLAAALLTDTTQRLCAHLDNQPALCSQTGTVVDRLVESLHAVFASDHVVLVAAARVWRCYRLPRTAHVMACVNAARPSGDQGAGGVDDVLRCVVEKLTATATSNATALEQDHALSFLQLETQYSENAHVSYLTTALLVVSLLAGMGMAYMLQATNVVWASPAFGINTSMQTSVNVVSKWIEIASIFVLVALNVLVNAYAVFLSKRNAGLFHAPLQSALDLDECHEFLGEIAKRNSLSTFVSGERTQWFVVARDRDATKAMSFDEWNEAKADQQYPDPLRALVKCYFVDERAQRDLASNGQPFGVDNPKALLRRVYKWRKTTWQLGTVLDRMKLYQDTPEEREALREMRADRMQVVAAGEGKLVRLLGPAWANVVRHTEFLSSGARTHRILTNALSWGAFIVPASLFAKNFLGFLDMSPECPALINTDGSIKQNLLALSHTSKTARLPAIYNARTWMCSHTATINVEEGAACSLRCRTGYTAAFGNTVCDSLGGGGMAWTHLNGGLSSGNYLDFPACCVSEATASNLATDFNVTLRAPTVVKFDWNTDVGFSHGCGANQTLDMQVCVFTQAEVAGGHLDRVCSEFCEHPDQHRGKCFSKHKGDLVPVALWEGFNARKASVVEVIEWLDFAIAMQRGVVQLAEGAAIGDVDVAVPSGSQLRARLVFRNANGETAGPWREIAPAAP